jgi:predicted dinucleotide-binding enzyme
MVGTTLTMKIGIIGSDDRALGIGRLLAGGGHEVTFGDPKRPERAEQLASRIGSHAEIPYQQAMKSDLLVFAIHPEEVDRAVTAVGSGADAVIVDAVPDEVQGPHNGAEALARKLDTNRIVRVDIHEVKPGADVEVCGDDPTSKALVDQALSACGCETHDRGPLAKAS